LQTTPSGLCSTPVSFHHIEPPGCIPWVDLSSLSLRALAASAAFFENCSSNVSFVSAARSALESTFSGSANDWKGGRDRSSFFSKKAVSKKAVSKGINHLPVQTGIEFSLLIEKN